MSLRQCLRCLRMKREVKRGGICDQCRRLVPDRREPKQPRRSVAATSAPSNIAVKSGGGRTAAGGPAARTSVTIIGSHAPRGESVSAWTLAFEGEVAPEQRQAKISRLLETFARLRVFVAKQLVGEFTAGEVAGPRQETKRPETHRPEAHRPEAKRSPETSSRVSGGGEPRLNLRFLGGRERPKRVA